LKQQKGIIIEGVILKQQKGIIIAVMTDIYNLFYI